MNPSRIVLWGIMLALGGSLVLSVNDMAVRALSDAIPCTRWC
jgi:hypothetical protein